MPLQTLTYIRECPFFPTKTRPPLPVADQSSVDRFRPAHQFSTTMSLMTSFSLAQLPLLAQAFLLHPHYRASLNSRLIRLALVPLALFLLTSFGAQCRAHPSLNSFTKMALGSLLVGSCLRSLIWGTSTRPYHRISDLNPSGSSVLGRLWFAIELISSPRGIGWSFGVPAVSLYQTRTEFLHITLRRLSLNLAIFVGSVICLAMIDSGHFGYPLLFRHLTSFFVGIFAWTMIDITGCFVRLLALCFNLNLSHVPFFLNSPIQATNLADFWSRRWHSLAKHIFVEAGSRPATAIARSLIGEGSLTRSIGILAAFVISGLMHEFGLWYATSPDLSFRTTIFFAAQGLGVVLESSFRKLTGYRVQGWVGRVWMLSWLVGWGRLMIDAWMEQDAVSVDLDRMRSYLSLYRVF